jgi:hypothetical protein
MIYTMQMVMDFSFKVRGFLFKTWSPNGDKSSFAFIIIFIIALALI